MNTTNQYFPVNLKLIVYIRRFEVNIHNPKQTNLCCIYFPLHYNALST